MEEEHLPSSWSQKLASYKLPFIIFSLGLLLTLVGLRIYISTQQAPIEFISDTQKASPQEVAFMVHVDGAVEKPGVYSVNTQARVQDVLIQAGGVAVEADRDWIAQQLNLAQKVTDGMKLYIPRKGELVNVGGTGQVAGATKIKSVSINQASQSELEGLAGIGPVTATKIISNRPYQTIEELVSKKAINQSLFNKVKSDLSL